MRSRNKRKSQVEHNTSRVIQSNDRKDRHSKVSTVKGPKDRRLRLSPKTAIQFYDVQDRLGFERPSEAIEWLMREAKDAIDALNSGGDHRHHHTPPEVASDFDHRLNDGNCEQIENPISSDFSFLVDEDNHVSSSSSYFIDGRGMFSAFDENWDCCDEDNRSLGHDQMFPRREQFGSVDTYSEHILSRHC